MFTLLEGELEVTFRGEVLVAHAGETLNIPANAPHHFKNVSGRPARVLCLCAPAGQDEYFKEIGTAVPTRTTTVPKPTGEQWNAFVQKAVALAPRYHSELLPPE